MASTAHLDTHVAVWLHDARIEKLSDRQREVIEESQLHISEFVRLELQYLYEIGRLKVKPADIVSHLAAHAGVVLSACPLHVLMNEAMKVTWTRDPFDRLIVANALVEKASLVTLDGTILKHCRLAVG
jgi:PIN domain nuclease of toxin-antitoxin system